MQKINIKAIIEGRGLDIEEVAAQLFPRNLHARLALNRVINGEGLLNSEQISKFALLLGVPISALFTGNDWKIAYKETTHVLTNKEYTAEIDTNTWTARLFHNESMLHETILFDKSIALSDFIGLLNSEILKVNQK